MTDALSLGDHNKFLAHNVATGCVGYVHLQKEEKPNLQEFYGESVLVNPSSEGMGSVSQLALFDKFETDVGKYIAASVKACEAETTAKCKQLDELLVAKPTFVGSVGHVQNAKLKENFCGIATIGQANEAGAEGWVMASYQNYRRADGESIPAPGAPSIFYSLDKTYIVYTCSMSQICKEGVAFQDFEAWLETVGGQEYMKKA